MRRWVFTAAASAAACAQAFASPAQAATPRARIEGELDPALRAQIAAAVGETDRPIANRFEARRRAIQAGEDAIAALRSEGYYGYEVEPDLGEEDTATPVVRISPGPRFTIANPAVEWLDPAPDEATRAAGAEAVALRQGAPGRAVDVIAAEGRVVAAAEARGYADTQAEPREVIVDHADRTLSPNFRIRTGTIVRLDGVRLVTDGHTDPIWLNRLTTWKPGDVYDPEDVAELERRLLDTGVYDSVTVALAPPGQTGANGLRPVVVSLASRSRRTVELGASYSTTEGLGLDARTTRYNLLRRADTATISARASNIDSRLAADISLPHWRRAQQTLRLGGAAYRTRTDAYDETGFGVKADVERRFRKTSFLTVGATLDVSRTDETQVGTLRPLGRDLVIGSALGVLSLDRSDDPLNPRSGWRMEARVEPTLIAGGGVTPYFKAQVQGSAYLPLGEHERTVLAARIKFGGIVGGTLSQVPAPRRFYAGGGGSVRGYAYQAVGPRLPDNTPQGGLSLFESAFEVRQKLTRNWSVVAFVDGGAVGADQFPAGKDFSAGAGLGVRYDLGFAPLRVDIAIPLDKRRGDQGFQIYLSIGQSF